MDSNHSIEESKDASRRVHSISGPELSQVDSDFALAMQLQEQERASSAFVALETLESESESEMEEEEEEEIDDVGYEFFDSLGFDEDLGFLEDESGTDLEMEDEDEDEEDDIDPDELSYEELIALGEVIGVEKRGLSENEISGCLLACSWRSRESKTGIDRCVICQVEYEEGENVVALCCQHPYHSECISKWLQLKKNCPICGNEVSSSPKPAKPSTT